MILSEQTRRKTTHKAGKEDFVQLGELYGKKMKEAMPHIESLRTGGEEARDAWKTWRAVHGIEKETAWKNADPNVRVELEKRLVKWVTQSHDQGEWGNEVE